MEDQYEKILIYQYGKVGSTSIRCNTDGGYYEDDGNEYNEYLIQTHSHCVAKDVLNKYKNVLVINIVRLPVHRNLSAFWENIRKLVPHYTQASVEDINPIFEKCSNVTDMDNWMMNMFDVLDIDFDTFQLDSNYKEMKVHGNTYLFFRFEDYAEIIQKVLPKYGLDVIEKKNESCKKPYAVYYMNHKASYKLSPTEKANIQNSRVLKKFYTEKELSDHIEQWS